MPSETNKRIVHRLYDEMINPNHLDRLGEVISDEFIGAAGTRGPASFAAVANDLRTAFPDLHYALEDVVADDDHVAVRWTLRGTHSGAFRGLAPTGKRIENEGFAIFRIAQGKIVQARVGTDRLDFLMSIGRIPYEPAFGAPPRVK